MGVYYISHLNGGNDLCFVTKKGQMDKLTHEKERIFGVYNSQSRERKLFEDRDKGFMAYRGQQCVGYHDSFPSTLGDMQRFMCCSGVPADIANPKVTRDSVVDRNLCRSLLTV